MKINRHPRNSLFLLIVVATVACSKAGEPGKTAPSATSSSTNTRSEETASSARPAANPAGAECQALRDKVAELATAARKCESGAKACSRCVPGYLHHCGIFVGDENSSATREYLDRRKELFDKACVLPTTATPPCSNDAAGKCSAGGVCEPVWCNAP
jgi:hypothetical protein